MSSSSGTFIFSNLLLFVLLALTQVGIAAPIIGEIRSFAGATIPSGWLACDGAVLEIAEPYIALFNVIRTTFGGSATQFVLPNLNGRVAIGAGASQVSLNNYVVGDTGGESAVTLTIANMNAHTHVFRTGTDVGTLNQINSNNIPCTSPNIPMYSTAATNFVNMHGNAVGNAGGNQGHTNMMPYLVSDLYTLDRSVVEKLTVTDSYERLSNI